MLNSEVLGCKVHTSQYHATTDIWLDYTHAINVKISRITFGIYLIILEINKYTHHKNWRTLCNCYPRILFFVRINNTGNSFFAGQLHRKTVLGFRGQGGVTHTVFFAHLPISMLSGQEVAVKVVPGRHPIGRHIRLAGRESLQLGNAQFVLRLSEPKQSGLAAEAAPEFLPPADVWCGG